MQQAAVFAKKLDEIRPRFLAQLLQRLDRFDVLRDRLELREVLDGEVEEIKQGAHRISGLAASLGFDDLGEFSRRVEVALFDLAEKGPVIGPLPADVLNQVDDLLGEMALLVG